MSKKSTSKKNISDASNKSKSPKAISFVGKHPISKAGPEVNIPCQRGKDLKTKGQHCDGKRAYNTSPTEGGRQASFQCIKCGFQWSVDMGGSFSRA